MVEGIKIGISSCLLGNPVRYDGGHKLDRFLADTLGQYVEYVPVCPEVKVGFPVPREALRLVGDYESPRLVTTHTKEDHTERMVTWARKRVKGQITPDEKLEMLQIIRQYLSGHVPLVVPVTLINHYVRKYGEPYLCRQVYLNPRPMELQLRNHV
jgi:2-thiouracil desulfurase/Protein of unknown function (DUF1722)